MIGRIIYIFIMCMCMRCIKTVQDITKINGHKRITAFLIALDTTLFLFVFRDIIVGEPDLFVFLSVAGGYIVGYYVGSYIEDRMALGKVKVSIKIAKEKSHDIAAVLKKNGFVFIQSKRFYSHKGKLRKIHDGIIYRNELPYLKSALKDFKFIASVEPIKSTFGKNIISSKEYLELNGNL